MFLAELLNSCVNTCHFNYKMLKRFTRQRLYLREMTVNTADSCCSQSTHSPVENKQLEAFNIATIQVTHQDLRPFETGIRSTGE